MNTIIAHLGNHPHIHIHDAVAALAVVFALGLLALATQRRSK